MRFGKQLFSVILLTFFLGVMGFSQTTMKDELSYTEDQTWFNQKKGWSEVTQSRQRQPWRQATWEERINHFISAIRKGDRKAFLFVEYSLLDGYNSAKGYPRDAYLNQWTSSGAVQRIYVEARKANTSVANWLSQGDAKTRANVIKATLSGLFNKDPRVRLVAVNLLRRLRPDPSMARDVKRALVLETVTTERAKWRLKDIDVPSIENPRLGWGAVAWAGGSAQTESLSNKYLDGSEVGDILNGNGKGLYLTQGLYNGSQRNDYRINVTDMNHTTGATATGQVWTKASLLRYGADEQVSGFETEYGLAATEKMPKYVYVYIDYHDPATGRVGEKYYAAYHSVWEEMKKLDLFITRAIWTNRVRRGDINSLRFISKDTFRALADQIDGESLSNVPMKSPSFKIFGEAEYRAVIVGMLENRVVSTREECVRFLKRLFGYKGVSVATKREIKKALREARRRELAIDVIRGRHLHNELVAPRTADEWWGERDEVDTNDLGGNRLQRLQRYRNQVEFPEETDIIYHDRRKPGQADDDDDDDDDDDTPKGGDATTGGTTSSTEGGDKGSSEPEKEEAPARLGHPLLTKSKITFADVKGYLKIQEFLMGVEKKVEAKPEPKKEEAKPEPKKEEAPAKEEDDDDDDDEEVAPIQSDVRPGQAPGVILMDKDGKSVRGTTAIMYERIRGLETINALLTGDGDFLVKAPFVDIQNAMLIWMEKVNDATSAATNLTVDPFLWYLVVGASSATQRKIGFRGNEELGAELERGENVRKMFNFVWEATTKQTSNGNYQLTHTYGLAGSLPKDADRAGIIKKRAEELQKARNEYYTDIELDSTTKAGTDAPVPPGRSGDPKLGSRNETSDRADSVKSFGKYYGHGRGGYYRFYDQQINLSGNVNNNYELKLNLGFYNFPPALSSHRDSLVKACLKALEDKDPQKRLLFIHLLRRLIPDASMLPKVNQLLRELETVDKRPYKYFSTITFDPRTPGVRDIKREEKIVGHELLKLQRFIVRRILVNKITGGSEPGFLKEIPKGSFLTLVVRIDAEWDPFRIPLRSMIAKTPGNGMFFTGRDIEVIKGGLENRNFLVQRECARWIVSFYNQYADDSSVIRAEDKQKFLRAIKFAEARDIVYYERNYVNWTYAEVETGKDASGNPIKGIDYHKTTSTGNQITLTKGSGVVGVPVGRVAVRIGSNADRDIFNKIDEDRKVEFEDKYGRAKDSDLKNFNSGTGSVRQIYSELEKARNDRKEKFGDTARDDQDLDAGGQ